jgi:hypothetical protein
LSVVTTDDRNSELNRAVTTINREASVFLLGLF